MFRSKTSTPWFGEDARAQPVPCSYVHKPFYAVDDDDDDEVIYIVEIG